MNLKNNLKLWLPCDEESGNILYDHAMRNDFAFANAVRGVGKMPGRSAVFTKGTYAVSSSASIDLTSSFTTHFWIKNTAPVANLDNLLFMVINFVTPLQYTEKQINVDYGIWHAIDLVYDSVLKQVKIYVDGKMTDSFSVSQYSAISSITFNQPWYFNNYGEGELDDVRVYQYALSDSDIAELFMFKYNPVKYFMDGIDLADYGLIVYAHNGLVSLPTMKEPLKVEWPDFHGEMIDLTDPTYEARDITLSCWIKADDRFQFFDKMNRLIKDILMKPGTHQLLVDIHPTKPMIYYVYSPGGIDVARQTKYNNAIQAGKFDLKFREPDPFKRILKHVATVINSTGNVTFHTDKVVTIYWGDGQKVTASGDVNLNHVYALAGEYYITIVGNVEEIIGFTSTAIPVWTLL